MLKLKNSKYSEFLLVLAISLGVCWNLLKPGYFSMHDDLQVMRLYEMEKCFLDGQIPCRWVPDMGANFGYPLFNFYSPFPYYLGMIFRIFGFSFVNIVKTLFSLSLVLSGLAMYLLVGEFFGGVAGVVAAGIYLYAPYHAVDVFVRGALAESWALVFFPLIFLTTYKFVKVKNLKWFVAAVFSLFGLFLSHNIMTILFVPFVIIWLAYWLTLEKDSKLFFASCLIFAAGFGLASFFVLPSFMEKSLVNISWLTKDYFDYRNHFVSLFQLFVSRFWGFGPSKFGPEDEMSFQLGFVHWLSAFLGGILALYFRAVKKGNKTRGTELVFLLWLFSVFMTHAKSVFVWEKIALLAFVQFPWRFLAISMFLGAFLSGFLVSQFGIAKQIIVSSLLLFLTVLLNFSYFKPEFFFPGAADESILSDGEWRNQSMGAILDYLPKKVKTIPTELAPSAPWIVEGSGRISEYAKRSDFWRFTFEGINADPVKVRVPIFDFPTWVVLVDQKKVSFTSDNPEGIIEIIVPPGKHTVVGWFENTPIRTLGNALTVITFSVLIILLVVFGNKKVVNEKII